MPGDGLLEIIGPALVAGLMIALTHAPFGIEVLKRGIIFIDLAIAQIAGLGLVAARLFLHEPPHWLAQSLALACAALAGWLFYRVETVMPRNQEAIIGCGFVLAASLAILLLAGHPHGGEEIKHLFSGQMLFITWTDVILQLPVYALILAIWFLWPHLRSGPGFYLLFALMITSSVQLAGVYVVFASLILPALAVFNYTRPYIGAWLLGFVAVALGIVFATISDLPAGPTMTLSYAVVSGVFVMARKLIR